MIINLSRQFYFGRDENEYKRHICFKTGVKVSDVCLVLNVSIKDKEEKVDKVNKHKVDGFNRMM